MHISKQIVPCIYRATHAGQVNTVSHITNFMFANNSNRKRIFGAILTPLNLGTSGQISLYDFIQGLSNISNGLEVMPMVLTSLESLKGNR